MNAAWFEEKKSIVSQNIIQRFFLDECQTFWYMYSFSLLFWYASLPKRYLSPATVRSSV